MPLEHHNKSLNLDRLADVIADDVIMTFREDSAKFSECVFFMTSKQTLRLRYALNDFAR